MDGRSVVCFITVSISVYKLTWFPSTKKITISKHEEREKPQHDKYFDLRKLIINLKLNNRVSVKLSENVTFNHFTSGKFEMKAKDKEKNCLNDIQS